MKIDGLHMNDVLEKYLSMRDQGHSAEAVYRAAFADGFKRSECLLMLTSIFDFELHQARDVAHKIYRSEETPSGCK